MFPLKHLYTRVHPSMSSIKGMFHQVRLLPEDRPLLRFLWWDLQREIPPPVYEWQVLPFKYMNGRFSHVWESELPHLSTVSIPRCYVSVAIDNTGLKHRLHVFCDASERAYGAVAYLSTTHEGLTNVSFIMARSKVAPKHQQTMLRLELCAALAGGQLAK